MVSTQMIQKQSQGHSEETNTHATTINHYRNDLIPLKTIMTLGIAVWDHSNQKSTDKMRVVAGNFHGNEKMHGNAPIIRFI